MTSAPLLFARGGPTGSACQRPPAPARVADRGNAVGAARMRRRGLIRTSLLAALAGVLVGPLTGPAAADHRLELRAPAVVSNPDAGIGAAHKVRILRLADGTLVVAYADRADPDGGHEVWDLTGES